MEYTHLTVHIYERQIQVGFYAEKYEYTFKQDDNVANPIRLSIFCELDIPVKVM